MMSAHELATLLRTYAATVLSWQFDDTTPELDRVLGMSARKLVDAADGLEYVALAQEKVGG